MRRQVLLLTTSALILAYGAMAATAQGPMTPQPDQHHPQQTTPGQEGSMGQGGMMGRGMMGGGMMGGGMMMGPPIMMRMIFALMDADGDGPSHCRSFRRLTSGSLRRWTPIKMAALLRRRCKRLCKEPGDQFRRSRAV